MKIPEEKLDELRARLGGGVLSIAAPKNREEAVLLKKYLDEIRSSDLIDKDKSLPDELSLYGKILDALEERLAPLDFPD